MLRYPHFEPHFPRERWLLPAILEDQAVRRPDSPFLQWTDACPPYSFARTNTTVNRLAHGLASLGVRKGDRVALFLPNCPEFVFSCLALMKLGAVEVAIGDTSKGSFLAHQLRLSDPAIVITTADLAHRLVELESPELRLTTCVLLPSPEGHSASVPQFARIRSLAFSTVLSELETNPRAELRPSDPAAVLFTSGTTGPSKGVVMSHSQVYFFAEEDCQLTGLRPDDVYMTGFPLFPHSMPPPRLAHHRAKRKTDALSISDHRRPALPRSRMERR